MGTFEIISFIFAITLIPMMIFAPWIPTKKRDVERILALASPKPGDVLYDLGSGDGKVLFGMVGKASCRLIGIESYLPLYLFSIIKKRLQYPEADLRFRLGNLFNHDLGDADVIYVFGLEGKMDRLSDKIDRECRKGTKVLSYAFPFPKWKEVTRDKPSERDLSIYLYVVG